MDSKQEHATNLTLEVAHAVGSDVSLSEGPDEPFSSRDATEEDLETLPRVRDKIPLQAWVAIIAAASERFTYFGVIAPWQNYMQNPSGNEGVPGALDLGQSLATNISNAFFLSSYLSPVLFAIVSDMWLGRFKTLLIGLVFYICGCTILTITSIPRFLDSETSIAGFAVALFFISLASGSIKVTAAPFIGDQYQEMTARVVRKSNGELVVVDRARTLQFMYNMYYWLTNIASLSIVAITFLEWRVGFWAAYVLPTAFLCIPVAILLLSSSKLVRIAPEGNSLAQAAKILACAMKSGFNLDKTSPDHQEKVKGRKVSWTIGTVGDVKKAMTASRVLLSLVMFYLCVNQIFNNSISQAGQMRLGGVPNDLVQVFSAVACIILGPALQVIYDMLAKHRVKFGPMARITTAFVFCGIAMGYCAGLQKLIYSTGPCYDEPLSCAESEGGTVPNNVSVWTQIPLYFFLGIAEILGFVTVFEYTYQQAPENMKSMIQAVAQLTACIASALGMAISPAAKDPNLVIMYSALAGAAGLSALVFWFFFRKHDRVSL